jgi:hypothetical protein
MVVPSAPPSATASALQEVIPEEEKGSFENEDEEGSSSEKEILLPKDDQNVIAHQYTIPELEAIGKTDDGIEELKNIAISKYEHAIEGFEPASNQAQAITKTTRCTTTTEIQNMRSAAPIIKAILACQEGLNYIVLKMSVDELNTYITRINVIYNKPGYEIFKLKLLQHIASVLHQAALRLATGTKSQKTDFAEKLECTGHASARVKGIKITDEKIQVLEDWIKTCHKNYKEREQQQRK